jgi:hypothetical protein
MVPAGFEKSVRGIFVDPMAFAVKKPQRNWSACAAQATDICAGSNASRQVALPASAGGFLLTPPRLPV